MITDNNTDHPDSERERERGRKTFSTSTDYSQADLADRGRLYFEYLRNSNLLLLILLIFQGKLLYGLAKFIFFYNEEEEMGKILPFLEYLIE